MDERTVAEVFAKIKAHMLEGMVMHDEMARYYSFLNLKGYEKCHEYHYAEETKNYRNLCRYYMEHHNTFIPHLPMNQPDVIPEGWRNAKRKDVDKGTKQAGVKAGMSKWVEWEKKTKELFSDMYFSLVEIGEAAAAEEIARYVRDVDDELKCAESKHLTLESIGYDLSTIVSEQDMLYEKYRSKLANIF